MRKLVLGLAVIIARFVGCFGAKKIGHDSARHKFLETELLGEDGIAIGRCVMITNGRTSIIVDAWLERAVK